MSGTYRGSLHELLSHMTSIMYRFRRSLLRYKKLFLHIDATFDGAPRGFYQVLIFSVLDQGTNVHVPIFYCLMTKKSEDAYNLLWMHITMCIGEIV